MVKSLPSDVPRTQAQLDLVSTAMDIPLHLRTQESAEANATELVDSMSGCTMTVNGKTETLRDHNYPKAWKRFYINRKYPFRPKKPKKPVRQDYIDYFAGIFLTGTLSFWRRPSSSALACGHSLTCAMIQLCLQANDWLLCPILQLLAAR